MNSGHNKHKHKHKKMEIISFFMLILMPNNCRWHHINIIALITATMICFSHIISILRQKINILGNTAKRRLCWYGIAKEDSNFRIRTIGKTDVASQHFLFLLIRKLQLASSSCSKGKAQKPSFYPFFIVVRHVQKKMQAVCTRAYAYAYVKV